MHKTKTFTPFLTVLSQQILLWKGSHPAKHLTSTITPSTLPDTLSTEHPKHSGREANNLCRLDNKPEMQKNRWSDPASTPIKEMSNNQR